MELFGMDKENETFGKAATAIWIMQLPVERRLNFASALAKLFLDMSAEEFKAIKTYTNNGNWHWVGAIEIEMVKHEN